jgi:hypothetical protein
MDKIKKTLGEMLNLEGASQEEQEAMLDMVSKTVLQGALAKIIEAMDDEEGDNFEMFLKQDPNPEQLVAYLEERIPNFEDFIKQEAENFKQHAEKVMPDIEK